MSYHLVLALVINGSAALFFEGTTPEGQPVWSSSITSARRFSRDEASHVRKAIPALAAVRVE